jgi:hypothetical protein
MAEKTSVELRAEINQLTHEASAEWDKATQAAMAREKEIRKLEDQLERLG